MLALNNIKNNNLGKIVSRKEIKGRLCMLPQHKIPLFCIPNYQMCVKRIHTILTDPGRVILLIEYVNKTNGSKSVFKCNRLVTERSLDNYIVCVTSTTYKPYNKSIQLIFFYQLTLGGN